MSSKWETVILLQRNRIPFVGGQDHGTLCKPGLIKLLAFLTVQLKKGDKPEKAHPRKNEWRPQGDYSFTRMVIYCNDR